VCLFYFFFKKMFGFQTTASRWIRATTMVATLSLSAE
jgi:hypothetical protein